MELQGYSVGNGKRVSVRINEGLITDCLELETKQEDGYVSPGFVDIQVNGYRGIDYSSEAFTSVQLATMVRYLAAAGVTRHLPTITTAPQGRILGFIEKIKLARSVDALISHAVPGIHIEGPYISGEDGPRGTHDAAFVRNPDLREFFEWYEACEGLLKIVTLAPELPGAMEFIKEVSTLGVVVAIGHTAASRETILQAVEAGASLSTHLGNGSAAKLPRLRNFLWPQVASDALSASIIADGHHLPPEVVVVFSRTKGLDNLILVSDVAPLGGYPKGNYAWGNVSVAVFEDGHIGLPGTEILAGAAHLLDWDIAHFMRYTGVSLVDAIRLCTQNAAKLIHLEHPTCALSAGEPADVVQFAYDGKGDSLRILKTVINGEVIYSQA